MANVIKLSHDEIRTISKKYIDASDSIDTTLSNLRGAQSELASVWEGDAFNAFEEQFSALEPKVKAFSELMTDINKQLNDIATTMANTDSEISNIVNKNTGSF